MSLLFLGSSEDRLEWIRLALLTVTQLSSVRWTALVATLRQSHISFEPKMEAMQLSAALEGVVGPTITTIGLVCPATSNSLFSLTCQQASWEIGEIVAVVQHSRA